MVRHNFSQKTRNAAIARAGDRCEAIGPRYSLEPGERCTAILSQTKVEVDHFPLSAHAEGSNTLENAVACCQRCNQYAANHTDKAVEAKIKRRQKRIDGTRRPRKPIPTPAKHKWPSRPFEKSGKPHKWR